jgi:formamidopyrimidine-DNA glycosylase
MPELPEVEAIRSQLERFLTGHTFQKIENRNPRIFQADPTKIEGHTLVGTRRFGKVLVLDLDNNWSIVAHVKMTGQFIYRGPNLPTPPTLSKKVTGGLGGPHTHVIFDLDKKGKLYYNDFRRFGWIKTVPTEEVLTQGLIGKMGPEPFKDLNLENFTQILSKTKRPIKVVLMDQARIGGIGNIYANDSLWRAQIDPRRPASSLDEREVKELFDAILEVLKSGMDAGGASENAFVTPEGGEGQYQDRALVYAKEGQLCQRCKDKKIEKFMLGGRGTFFCPVCQK